MGTKTSRRFRDGSYVSAVNELLDAPTWAGRAARKLYGGLKKAGKIWPEPKSLKPWAKVFSDTATQLSGRDGIEIEKAEQYLLELITDHVANIEDDYQPKCYSAKTFYENLLRIEEARKRRVKKREDDTLRKRREYEAAMEAIP